MLGFGEKAVDYLKMINPIEHSKTKMLADKYKVEPYVIAADIYSNFNHPGRGGWTWYTGSAAWFYRLGIIEILGFNKKGNKIYITPHVPKKWNKFEIEYKYLDTTYKIKINMNNSKECITLDGEVLDKDFFVVKNDKRVHAVVIYRKR